MFGIGPAELIAIVVLALILLGPEKFPEAGRLLGRGLHEFRAVRDDLVEVARPLPTDPDQQIIRVGDCEYTGPAAVDVAALRRAEADANPESTNRMDPESA